MTGIIGGSYGYPNVNSYMQGSRPVVNPGESTVVSPGRKSSPAECETCKNRKYQDGSDEMVSFKSAAHISPEASASRVRAHEQEHVSNAYKTPYVPNADALIRQAALLQPKSATVMNQILISRTKNLRMRLLLSDRIWI